jgi:hypothetical protein
MVSFLSSIRLFVVRRPYPQPGEIPPLIEEDYENGQRIYQIDFERWLISIVRYNGHSQTM